jgi:AcrR family transcriptional regulator
VTQDQILAAADRVARQHGFSQLTMRRLCAELGVTPPALYRQFSTKDQIVDRLIDDIIGRISLPGPDDGDWAERIRTCFVSAHDEVAPYGDLAARMGVDMPNSPNARRNSDYLLSVLTDGGVPHDDGIKIVAAVFVYIWGHLLTNDPTASMVGSRTEAQARDQFLWGLDHLVDSFRREYGGVVSPKSGRVDARPVL